MVSCKLLTGKLPTFLRVIQGVVTHLSCYGCVVVEQCTCDALFCLLFFTGSDRRSNVLNRRVVR